MKRLFAAVVYAIFLPAVLADTYTWTGKAENGDWDTPMNWDPSDQAPADGDSVIINNAGFVVTLTIPVSLASLTISNSELAGSGAVEVTAQSKFAYAAFGLAGGVIINGPTDIYPGSDPRTTFGCPVTNMDTVTVHGNAQVVVPAGFEIVNDDTWILTPGSQLSLEANSNATAFLNAGSFFLTNAMIFTGNDAVFNNVSGGSIQAFETNNFQGILDCTGDLIVTANSLFNIGSASLVYLGGSFSEFGTEYATLSGAGVVAINCFTVVSGGVVVLGTLQFAGDTLNLGGFLEVYGVFDWLNGDLLGTLVLNPDDEFIDDTVDVEAGGLLNIINNQNLLTLEDLVLTNLGTVVWTNSGELLLTNASIVNNGLFQISGDGTLGSLPGGQAGVYFSNHGKVEKNVGATNGGGTVIAMPFNDSGTLDVEQGKLEFTAGGTISDWTAEVAAGLTLGEGTFAGNNAATLQGKGSITLISPAVIELGDEDTLTVTGNFYHSSGTITGTGTLLIEGGLPGAYEWDGGTISLYNDEYEDVIVARGGTMNIEGAYRLKTLLSSTLENDGEINWTNDNDVGGISLGDKAEIINHGAFNVQCDAFMVDSSTNTNTAPVFVNAQDGTLSKTAETATTTFQLKFLDAGTIVAQAGVLEFAHFLDTYPNLPLPYILLDGGTIQFDNDPTVHAVISGSGQINAPQGLVLSGGQLIVITIIFDGDITDDELFDLSAYFGVITFVGGNFTQTANGTLVVPVQSTSPSSGYGKISNPRYSVTLGGTLKAVLTNGYAPPIGASFPFLNAGQLFNTFSNLTLPQGLTVAYTGTNASLVVTSATPVILAVPSVFDGQFQFEFQTVSNRAYTVEFSTSLNNSTWLVLTNFVAGSAHFSFAFPATSSPAGFIRVVEP